MRIYLYNSNHPKIASIGGTDIQVKHRPGGGGNSSGFHIRIFGIEIGSGVADDTPGWLETDTIEGDVIDLAYTRANRVSGRVVKIGPGCVIGMVEYTESAEIDRENSEVAEAVRV